MKGRPCQGPDLSPFLPPPSHQWVMGTQATVTTPAAASPPEHVLRARPSEAVPFPSHFTEEEAETQRKAAACQGHAVGSGAELGFEWHVAALAGEPQGGPRPPRTGHTDLAAASHPRDGVCTAHSRGAALSRALLGLLCRDRASLFSSAAAAGLCGLPRPPPPCPRETSLGARRATPCGRIVQSWRAVTPMVHGPWVPGPGDAAGRTGGSPR